MNPSPIPPEEVICPGCGVPNTPDTHFCKKCGAPLTWHATTDPLGIVYAEGFAARRAVSNPKKPIVIIGLWLWLLPATVVLVGAFFAGVVTFFEGLIPINFEGLVSGIIMMALSGVFLAFIFGPMLYKGTKNFLHNRREGRVQEEVAGGPNGTPNPAGMKETINCLACGQPMPSQTGICPACGWSYK